MVYSEYRWEYRLADSYLVVNWCELYRRIVNAMCIDSMIISSYIYQSTGSK